MIKIQDGVYYWPEFWSLHVQQIMLQQIRTLVKQAPLFTPQMPRSGKAFSVRMSNFGPLGWVSDKQNGYRYQAMHPQTNAPWPAIPERLLTDWQNLSQCTAPPEACLVNYYTDHAKMGMHQDRDEQTFDAPVLSFSLGNTCLFRVGGSQRGGKTRSVKLQSGDALMLSGPARLAFHGVERIYPGSNSLLKDQGRINLTLRRVTPF